MAHSYSSLSTFVTCPFLYNEKYNLKSIKFKQNEAAAYGSEMHSAMEDLIQDKRDFTPRYEFLRPIVTKVKSISGKKECEYELSFTEDWTSVGWWDKGGYIKGKCDLVIFHPTEPKMLLKDWKFAKPDNSRYTLEMKMFSLLNFKKHPEIEEIQTGQVWLKIPAPETKITFSKEDQPELEDEILGLIHRVDEANNFDNFPMKVSGLCKSYCDATTCPKNGKYKS